MIKCITGYRRLLIFVGLMILFVGSSCEQNSQKSTLDQDTLQEMEKKAISNENWLAGIQLLEKWQQNNGQNNLSTARLSWYRKLAVEKHLKRAQELVTRGEFEKARTELDQIHDLEPDNIEINRLLSFVLLKKEHFPEAVTILNKLDQQSHIPGAPPTLQRITLLLDKTYALRRMNRLKESEEVKSLAISEIKTFLTLEENYIEGYLQKAQQAKSDPDAYIDELSFLIRERNRLAKSFKDSCPLLSIEVVKYSQELDELEALLKKKKTSTSPAATKKKKQSTRTATKKGSSRPPRKSKKSTSSKAKSTSQAFRPTDWNSLPASLRNQIQDLEKQSLSNSELLYKCGVLLFQKQKYSQALPYFKKVSKYDCRNNQLDCYFIELGTSYIPLTLSKLNKLEEAINAEISPDSGSKTWPETK